jgi:hypothetical protein
MSYKYAFVIMVDHQPFLPITVTANLRRLSFIKLAFICR